MLGQQQFVDLVTKVNTSAGRRPSAKSNPYRGLYTSEGTLREKGKSGLMSSSR